MRRNRVVIELARERLEHNRFEILRRQSDQGTFPHSHTIARRDGVLYFIGATGREELGANRELNPSYNLVQTADDLTEALKLAQEQRAIPAFVSVALRSDEGRYSAYFGRLAGINFRRAIPMMPQDRRHYEELARLVTDPRVTGLSD